MDKCNEVDVLRMPTFKRFDVLHEAARPPLKSVLQPDGCELLSILDPAGRRAQGVEPAERPGVRPAGVRGERGVGRSASGA